MDVEVYLVEGGIGFRVNLIPVLFEDSMAKDLQCPILFEFGSL